MSDLETISIGGPNRTELLADPELPLDVTPLQTEIDKVNRRTEEISRELYEIFRDNRDARAAVRRDDGYRPEKKREIRDAVNAASARRLEKLNAWERVEYFRKKAEKRWEKALRPKRLMPVEESDRAEIIYRREQLLEMDQADRDAAVLEAGKQGDYLTLRAARDAPSFAPIADAETVDRALREYARQRFPETTAEADAYTAAADRIAGNTRLAIQSLMKGTGDRRFGSLMPAEEFESEELHQATRDGLKAGEPAPDDPHTIHDPEPAPTAEE